MKSTYERYLELKKDYPNHIVFVERQCIDDYGKTCTMYDSFDDDAKKFADECKYLIDRIDINCKLIDYVSVYENYHILFPILLRKNIDVVILK